MPTTYGNDIVYCLKSHCGVRGYCRQKWVLQVQIICKFSNERTCKRNKNLQGLSCGFEERITFPSCQMRKKKLTEVTFPKLHLEWLAATPFYFEKIMLV